MSKYDGTKTQKNLEAAFAGDCSPDPGRYAP